MRNKKTTKELYQRLISMHDLHSEPELNGDILTWKLFSNAYIRAYCDSYDTCIDIISDDVVHESLIHWHPDEEDMFDELYSLGKKGNILVLKKYLLGVGVFYIGAPDKYCFSKNQRWHFGKLIYLVQR